ncbi:VOC family protein [Bradyrhizobium sp. USDA 4486]
MIIGLHHVSLSYSNLQAGIDLYCDLLGRKPSARTTEDGADCAYFVLDNGTLRIASPRGTGPVADRIRKTLSLKEGALFDLAFLVNDVERTRQALKRISLPLGDIHDFSAPNLLRENADLSWRILELDNGLSNGVTIRFVQSPMLLPISEACADAAISRMDLVVIQTADPERALGLYAARFNLKLLFDRTNAGTGDRLIQLACGDMLIELTHVPARSSPGKPDAIWGLGWTVADAEASRARLNALGRNVSLVKDGAKPGTRVFTVRDGTCNIPTLVVEHVQPHRPTGS